MRTLTRNRLAKGCLTGAIAGATALGLVGCGAGEDEATTTDSSMMQEDTGSTESAGSAGDQESADTETDEQAEDAGNDDVDVAAISDEGAGADGVYDGTYDDEFLDEVTSFDGERVTVSAMVNEVVSDHAFTVGGIEDPDVEPLLVIHTKPLDFVEEDQLVLVTGVVHKAYRTSAAEHQLGMQLEDVELSEWGQEPYIETDTVGELSDDA